MSCNDNFLQYKLKLSDKKSKFITDIGNITQLHVWVNAPYVIMNFNFAYLVALAFMTVLEFPKASRSVNIAWTFSVERTGAVEEDEGVPKAEA